MEPYRLSTHEVMRQLSTKPSGLTSAQVHERQMRDGFNELPQEPMPSWIMVFIRQFQSPLIYILLIAALIIFFIGPDTLDAFIISGVLFFNALVGAIQEGRTRAILQSLTHFLATDCIVVREGQQRVIPDRELVIGDSIVLQAGQRVPADARLFQVNNLEVDEAMLTGESVKIIKTTQEFEKTLGIADQTNMVFRGTYILAGSAKALVVATGVKTQVGMIHKSVQEIQMDMPLKRELAKVSYWILAFILGVCSSLFIIGFLSGKPIRELLVMLTALFICVVPEGLPVVLTLVLMAGVYRMAKKNVLVKNMQAVEGLGRTDVIVTDKTGTLTRNEMMVARVCADGIIWNVSGAGYDQQGTVLPEDESEEPVTQKSSLVSIGKAASLLNTTHISFDALSGLYSVQGDPTEAALFVFSLKLGLERKQLEQEYHLLYEIPFDSALKYHAGFYEINGKGCAFIIGSPEVILAASGDKELEHMPCVKEFLSQGLRIVACAQKSFDLSGVPDAQTGEKERHSFFTRRVETDLSFLGVCAIQDAIRSEVKDSIARVQEAGLRVVMATGDHRGTAAYVAKAVGIMDNQDQIIDGDEFDQASDEIMLGKLDVIRVFARVSPHHKLRIIDLYHKKNLMVAMTGDGINDAPSLVAADLGIAMGRIGTEVAKQASDIILLDDSFVNIVSALEQGRHIFYTLKRIVLYFFATNMGEILIIGFALVFRLPLPLTAAQILWLNLVTDGFLDVALSMEPQEKGLLAKKWRHGNERLVDRDIVLRMMFMAVPMGVGSLWVFIRYYQSDIVLARTMTLLTMAMFQWFNAWNCRSMTQSIFELGFLSNRWLLATTSFVLTLQIMLIYAPFMQYIFKTIPLDFFQWLLVISVSSSVVLFEEVRKGLARWLS